MLVASDLFQVRALEGPEGVRLSSVKTRRVLTVYTRTGDSKPRYGIYVTRLRSLAHDRKWEGDELMLTCILMAFEEGTELHCEYA